MPRRPCCYNTATTARRAEHVDFDVLVYTNTFAEEEAAAGGRQPYLDAVGALFDGLSDGQRQCAVINLDGGWRVGQGVGAGWWVRCWILSVCSGCALIIATASATAAACRQARRGAEPAGHGGRRHRADLLAGQPRGRRAR